ncbi:MAG TPA: hypothetical protein VKB93_23610 [Thermoanaerobaculia bacterium]|nr:hypothetical protein [Thermoanaerobaculia bacterium]
MRKRIPTLLFALGTIGVALYPRLVASLPVVMRTDFNTGLAMGVFLGIELLGVALMVPRRVRCAR